MFLICTTVLCFKRFICDINFIAHLKKLAKRSRAAQFSNAGLSLHAPALDDQNTVSHARANLTNKSHAQLCFVAIAAY